MATLIAACVWNVSAELIVALDERFGEPHDAYVNGSQVWLREDGPNGETIEWRLHPVAFFQRPAGLTTYALFPTVALALAEHNPVPASPSSLWDGLEAFAAYEDEIEPAALANSVREALGLVPHHVGLVDHDLIGNEWEGRRGEVSIVAALIDQLTAPAGQDQSDSNAVQRRSDPDQSDPDQSDPDRGTDDGGH